MIDHSDASIVHPGKFMTMMKRQGWEFVARNNITGIIVIVPLTDDGKLILVEQHRIPVKADVIELPAGLVGDDGDADEKLEVAAQRELMEETGYVARCWRFLCEGPPSPGLSDEIVSFFLATGLKRTGKGGGVHDEQITVHEVPLAGVRDWLSAQVAQGKMMDPKIYTGVYFAEKVMKEHPDNYCEGAERIDEPEE